MDDQSPDLLALRRKLDDEDAAYASVLAAIDALATFPLPAEKLPELPSQMARLNSLWTAPAGPQRGGPIGRFHRSVWGVMAPAIERQTEFSATVVQILNGQVDETARLHARLRDLVAALMRYLQRVLPVMDARDRMA
ncbi:MAG: hypothetical protein ACHQNV_09050, partial [Vicinamibacteria bacterium]